MTAPVPPADDEQGPVDRHTTVVLISRTALLATAVAVTGRGQLRIGTDTSSLSVAVEDIDTARRLHEQTGQLLTGLEQLHRRRMVRAVPGV